MPPLGPDPRTTAPPAAEPKKICPKSTPELVGIIMRFMESLTAVRLYNYQRVFVARVVESVLENDGAIITALWSRQCLASDTVIHTREGRAVQIKDHPAAWYTGYKPVFRVRAANGAEVRATAEHPFLTERGWVPCEELTEDDRLCVMDGWDLYGDNQVPYQRETFVNRHRTRAETGEYTLTPELGKILGYLTADGYAFRALEKGQSVKFVNVNEEYLQEFEELVVAAFPDVKTTRYAKGRGFDVVCTSIYGKSYRGNGLRDFLRAMGPDDKFPTAIFRGSWEVVVAFLNRMYAADGCAYTTKDGQQSAIELACGGSPIYANYVRALLSKLGIHSQVKGESMSGVMFYRVTINDRTNLRTFLETVGPIFGKEAACSRVRLDYTRWPNRTTTPTTPGEDGEQRAWVGIRSISPDGETDVYDVTYPDKGWFFAHGIAVHNSGKTEAVALIAISLVLLLPALAREFEDDPRLMPFARGFRIGIFAPIDEQAKISYNRMREFLAKPAAEEVMRDQDIDVVVTTNRGDTLAFSNGSTIQARSASPDSQIEGKTFELVIAEESQKLMRSKVDKEIRPMLASTNGSMVKIGTAWESRGGFHTDIARNVELMKRGGKRSHFEFPYDRVIREKEEQYKLDKNPFHLSYGKFVQSEIARIGGTDSPEFKMNFRCLWQETQVTAVTEGMLEKGKLPEMETGLPRGGFQIGGLDLGKRNDRTVLTLGTVQYESPILNLVTGKDADADKQIYYRKQIHDWLELEGAFEGTTGQYQMIVAYLRMTQIKVLCVDSTGLGGDVITERLMDMLGDSITVIPFPFNTSSKSNLYKYYLQELGAGRLLFPAGPVTQKDPRYGRFIEENLSLDKETRGGFIAVSATEGSHDDYPDSAALMCWAEKVAQNVMLPQVEINTRGAAARGGVGFDSGSSNSGSRYGRRGYLK